MTRRETKALHRFDRIEMRLRFACIAFIATIVEKSAVALK